MSDRQYVRAADRHLYEQIPENEEADINAVADLINQQQQMVYNKARHAYTGTHCRTQGIIHGTLKTEPNLPPHLRQSMFADERSWPFIARYSTEIGDPSMDDRTAQPRGLAVKVFDVHGEMYDSGSGVSTQDIEFNSTPAIELADAKTTKEILQLRLAHGSDPQELYRKYEERSDTELQKARDQVPNTPLQSIKWYSQTAYRFGDYVVKYRLVPATETQEAEGGKKESISESSEPDVLSTELSEFHRSHRAEFMFQVQFLEDPSEQSVEYGGTEWDEGTYPFQTVARLSAPQQESWNFGLKNFWEDRMRLDPWMGL